MGKIDENKREKEERLLSTALKLFTEKGFAKTSISDIVEAADVAKGTFYLYFKDKYDLKDKITEYKTHELFLNAHHELREQNIVGLDNQLIFIIDYIIDQLKDDTGLLNLISKNLVLGTLRQTFISSSKEDNEVYIDFLRLVNEGEQEYENIDVLLFMVVELAGSSCYTSIIHHEPLPLEEYRTFLHNTIRLIVKSFQKNN